MTFSYERGTPVAAKSQAAPKRRPPPGDVGTGDSDWLTCIAALKGGYRVQGSGFRVRGSGFRVQGSGFRVRGTGFSVRGSVFSVQGAGCRVQG